MRWESVVWCGVVLAAHAALRRVVVAVLVLPQIRQYLFIYLFIYFLFLSHVQLRKGRGLVREEREGNKGGKGMG